ncbi:hypothetical protein AAHC03_01011 [Spirometra sp. Aus1]
MAVIPATQSIPLKRFDRRVPFPMALGQCLTDCESRPFVMRTGFASHTLAPGLDTPQYTVSAPSALSLKLKYPPCWYAITQLLLQEGQFYVDTSPLLYVDSISEDKVDAPMRDEALTRLRSLHRAYYDLSPTTFCKAVCLTDTFITRVKVKPKYMMCVAAACYYIASKFETCKQPRPTLDSLVRLSHCGGSASDLVRMVDIILTKLGSANVTAIGAASSTALNFLQLFLYAGSDPSDVDQNVLSLPPFLVRQLEIALCSTSTSYFRPSCLALALLSSFKRNPPPLELDDSSDTAFQMLQLLRLSDLYNLANICKVSWSDVEACSSALSVQPHQPSTQSMNGPKRTRYATDSRMFPCAGRILFWEFRQFALAHGTNSPLNFFRSK